MKSIDIREVEDTIYVNLSRTVVVGHLPGQERMMGHQMLWSTLALGSSSTATCSFVFLQFLSLRRIARCEVSSMALL